MKRLSRRSLGAALAIALAGLAIALLWVTATTPGARWLLTTLSPLGGVNFSAQKVEGKVIGHLLLNEVRIDLGQQQVEAGTLELRWRPLRLLGGAVALQELTLQGVRVQDDAPPGDQPPRLAWPRVSGKAGLPTVRIAKLLVNDLSYRRREEPPLQLTSLAASATWEDGLLTITELKAVAPAAQISGAISAGFRKPSLTADLTLALAQPVAEMDRFSLQARPGDTPGPEPFIGTVMLTGNGGNRRLLELGGELGMAANAINLRHLKLTRPGRKGYLTGEGSLTFTARESVLSLQIKATNLDLAPELPVATDLSGTLTFAGTLDNYRGDFTLINHSKGWQAAVVSATYQGSGAGLKLAPVKAAILDGSVTGNLD
ncbi:MAG TPA: hypothetical protein VLA15_06815, partial [Desulfurivibrionaceae bacterium]|nr:hypothetical protein [Desulfurivibrionaceae bacterium]